MTPRDPVDWHNAPPIPEEYRQLMESVERAWESLWAANLGAIVHRVYTTETSSVVPSSFQRPQLKERTS